MINNEMSKLTVTQINAEKLKQHGFVETEYGWEKEIEDAFRFRSFLVIQVNDIYGYQEKMRGNDVRDYEDFLDALGFKSPKARRNCEVIVSKLISDGAIVAEVK